MSSWARVGAKCVCIGRNPLWDGLPVATPAVGEEYTIREVQGDAVLLVEIHNRPIWFVPELGGPGEPNFGVWRFRPLVTKTQDQDVAMFKSLLTPAPELVE